MQQPKEVAKTPKKRKSAKKSDKADQRLNLLHITEKAINRLYSLAEDDELMENIDIKDLKNLTASVKELLSLSGELSEKSAVGGVVILPEVNENEK